MRIDNRCLAGDGNRFFQRADAQVGVNGVRGRAGQHDAIAFERVEPGQRERDGVRARTQIDDLIATVDVRHHRPGFLDQHWAGSFDRHAGEHGPRCVFDGSRDRRLRQSDGRNKQHERSRKGAELPQYPHSEPPVRAVVGPAFNERVRLGLPECPTTKEIRTAEMRKFGISVRDKIPEVERTSKGKVNGQTLNGFGPEIVDIAVSTA